MGTFRLLDKGYSFLRSEGINHLGKSTTRKAIAAVLRQTSLFRGSPIFDFEWDALVILDACRWDVLRQVAPEYDFIGDPPGKTHSVGSCSSEWMDRTFTDANSRQLGKTAYVTGNIFSETYAESTEFLSLIEVWKSHFDPDLGTIPPRPVTDRAIRIHRERDPDRLLVHYMQPHFPSIPEPLGFGIRKGAPNPNEQTWVWQDGKPDDYSQEELWRAYVENLRFILEEVELLIENIDAEKTILTADHGAAFGEWGMWGHGPRKPFRVLREVPWVETTAIDKRTHEPELNIEPDKEQSSSENERSTEEKLRALGYLG